MKKEIEYDQEMPQPHTADHITVADQLTVPCYVPGVTRNKFRNPKFDF